MIVTEMMNALVRVTPMISGLIRMMPATLKFDIDENVANITSTAMSSFSNFLLRFHSKLVIISRDYYIT